MEQEKYMKIVYVWKEPRAPIEVPDRLRFRSMDETLLPVLVEAIGMVMSDSMDRSDHKAVREHDAKTAAEQFVAEAKDYFAYQLAWWQLGYDDKGNLVGFVQPVTFPNCQKDGLEEATIYYVGILPEHRGKGYGYDLLCKATRLLQDMGVWQIWCDTDVYNKAMIQTFKRTGYEQEGQPKIVKL